jgi:hypothetical protein
MDFMSNPHRDESQELLKLLEAHAQVLRGKSILAERHELRDSSDARASALCNARRRP